MIAFNTGAGVTVNTGTGNAVLSNSIYSNTAGGIVLVNGGNNNQPPPVLTNALLSAGGTVIDGTLSVKANTSYLVQYFVNNPPSNQGRTLLGSQTIINTQANDRIVNLPSFTVTSMLTASSTITAIASVTGAPPGSLNPAVGDTSPFSYAIPVSPFVVTNTNNSGIGSLRNAIQAANTDVGNDDTITFQIPTSDPGYNIATGSWTIPVGSGPGLTINKPTSGGMQHTVFIDGLSQQSQPGAALNHPVIEIKPAPGNSSIGGYVGDGLTILSGKNTVRGLVVDSFQAQRHRHQRLRCNRQCDCR